MENKACDNEVRAAKTHLEDEAKRYQAEKDAFDRERVLFTREVVRLEAENTDIRELIGSLADLPDTSRRALGSIANLETVLEECIICSEILLSGIGLTSFGVTSYACGCSITRTLHLNCLLRMERPKCPHCSEDIVLIAPELSTPTAVRAVTVRRR